MSRIVRHDMTRAESRGVLSMETLMADLARIGPLASRRWLVRAAELSDRQNDALDALDALGPAERLPRTRHLPPGSIAILFEEPIGWSLTGETKMTVICDSRCARVGPAE